MDKAQIIIMAGGQGKRMQSDIPKPLVPLLDKPMIQYTLDAIRASGLCARPIVVVHPTTQQLFQETIGTDVRYAIQENPLGTGHAVMSAQSLLEKNIPTIVLNADHPTITALMLKTLYATHMNQQATITMGVVTVPHFDDWYQGFASWGRVMIDPQTHMVTRIVEAKDASEEELLVRTVNPSYFCFDTSWLCEHVQHLDNTNAQQEYYITDLIAMAMRQGNMIASSPVTPEEGAGINTPEQKQLVEQLLAQRV